MPDEFLSLVNDALPRLQAEFSSLPSHAEANVGGDGTPAAMSEVLGEVARRMADNYPYFHPLYAGQMMKPPHAIARAAYAMAMWINPNNHSLDGGRASSRFEVEAVAEIAAMFGWGGHLGHLTGGGTVANLEALWVAGKLHPGKRIVASSQAHYTHSRISGVLGLDFSSISVDGRGRMDLGRLEAELRLGEVGTVVATLGSVRSTRWTAFWRCAKSMAFGCTWTRRMAGISSWFRGFRRTGRGRSRRSAGRTRL